MNAKATAEQTICPLCGFDAGGSHSLGVHRLHYCEGPDAKTVMAERAAKTMAAIRGESRMRVEDAASWSPITDDMRKAWLQ